VACPPKGNMKVFAVNLGMILAEYNKRIPSEYTVKNELLKIRISLSFRLVI
jgi:hypothetical protein